MLTLWILSLDWKLTNNFLVLNSETTKSAVFGWNLQFSAENLWFSTKNHGFWQLAPPTIFKICSFRPKTTDSAAKSAKKGSWGLGVWLSKVFRSKKRKTNEEDNPLYKGKGIIACEKCYKYLTTKVEDLELRSLLQKNCCLLMDNIEPRDITDYPYQVSLLSLFPC